MLYFMIDFTKAHAAALRGKSIKRECWDTWLKIVAGQYQFQLKPFLASRLGTDYTPHQTDLVAVDWEVK